MTCRTQRNLWVQLSTHKSSVNLSPLLGNTLGETRMNLREPRNERKKNDQRLRNTADKIKKKHQMENSICSPSCGEQGNKPRDYTAANKVLLRDQREPAERGTIEGWNRFIWEPPCCKEHSRPWNNTAELDFVVLPSTAVCWDVLVWWDFNHHLCISNTKLYWVWPLSGCWCPQSTGKSVPISLPPTLGTMLSKYPRRAVLW